MSSSIEKNITRLVGKLYHQVIRSEEEGKHKEKNIILFVGKIYGHMIDAIRTYEKESKMKFRIGLIHDSKIKLDQYTQAALERIDVHLSCDFNSERALQKTITPYQDEILVLTTRSEEEIRRMAKVIPHVPYVLTPTVKSLFWSTDKIKMRERLHAYNPKITAAFTVVKNTTKATIKSIEEKVGYPLIVKPSGLAASRLVSICFHREELEDILKKVFKTIDQVYKKNLRQHEPEVLVEKFMEGDMYSLDAYVSADGKIYFCPMAHIKTGKTIGFDDFFGYRQITPTLLNETSIATAQMVARESIYALGLRNTVAHVELMKTEDGWKIVEVGPRIGGFRHMMYEFSFGINHTMNDVLIRMGKKPQISKKIKGYTVAMKFFAKTEGKLAKLAGIKKAQDLKSFKRVYINKKVGDSCKFAKNGGSSVFNIILFNKDRSKLLADIRRLETMIQIETK